MTSQNHEKIEELVLKKNQKRLNKKRLKMKVSGAGVKKLAKIIKNKANF